MWRFPAIRADKAEAMRGFDWGGKVVVTATPREKRGLPFRRCSGRELILLFQRPTLL